MRERERDLKLSNTKFAKTEFDLEKSGFCQNKRGKNGEFLPKSKAGSLAATPLLTASQEDPLVSVIVPFYNSERFLPRLIKCLKSQTLQSIEFILVDDGSTDAGLQTALELIDNDPRFTLLTQQNRGLYETRRVGFHAARGEFVSVVDSDDYVSRDIFSHLLDLAKTHNSQICICEFKVVEFSELNKDASFPQTPFKTRVFQNANEYLQDLILAELNFRPCSMTWARIFLKTLALEALSKAPTADELAEDFVMNVAIGLKASRVVKSDKICYAYVRHQGSMSHKYTPKHLQCLEENYEKISTLLQDLPSLNGLFTQMKRCRLALIGAYMALMGESFSKQEKRRSLRLLRSELGYIFKSQMAFKGKILALLLCVCPKLALFLLKHTPRKR